MRIADPLPHSLDPLDKFPGQLVMNNNNDDSSRPMSPRSALRSLQTSEQEQAIEEKPRVFLPPSSPRSRPWQSESARSSTALPRPLPPRKSSLAATRGVPSLPPLLDLPSPQGSHYVMSASPAAEPSLTDSLQQRSSSPSQGTRLDQSRRSSFQPMSTANSSPRPSPSGFQGSRSSLSARSFRTYSDRSSEVSLPLDSPSEPFFGHGSALHRSSIANAPASYQSGPDSRRYSQAYDRDSPYSHPSPRSSIGTKGHDDRSPFAHSVEAEEAHRAYYEGSYPYGAYNSRWSQALQSTSKPPPRAHLVQRPVRSVDDYLAPAPPPGSIPGAPWQAHRPSLPSPTSMGPPASLGVSRSSFDGDQRRVLAPLSRSPASVSHRASLPALAHAESNSVDATSQSPATSLHSIPNSRPQAHSQHARESSLSGESTLSSSPAISAKRSRDDWRLAGDGGEDDDFLFGRRPQRSVTTANSSNELLDKIASGRRSKSTERSIGAGLSRASTTSTHGDSKIGSKWQLDHAEVMAKLNKKMKERIALKKHRGTSSGNNSSVESLHRPLEKSSRQYRSASTASSTVTAAATPASTINASEPDSPMIVEAEPQAAPSTRPTVGIESLLSAAALDDAESAAARASLTPVPS